jgi:hypothetical protein
MIAIRVVVHGLRAGMTNFLRRRRLYVGARRGNFFSPGAVLAVFKKRRCTVYRIFVIRRLHGRRLTDRRLLHSRLLIDDLSVLHIPKHRLLAAMRRAQTWRATAELAGVAIAGRIIGTRVKRWRIRRLLGAIRDVWNCRTTWRAASNAGGVRRRFARKYCVIVQRNRRPIIGCLLRSQQTRVRRYCGFRIGIDGRLDIWFENCCRPCIRSIRLIRRGVIVACNGCAIRFIVGIIDLLDLRCQVF